MPKPTASASSGLLNDGSPLQKTLISYEQEFLHLLRQAEAFHKAAEQRLRAVEATFGEVQVQRRALQAAVMNLRDHADPVRAAFSEDSAAVIEEAKKQQDLLDRFPSALQKLRDVPLHPAIKKAAAARAAGQEPAAAIETLEDCVPVEKEVRYASQCQVGNGKLLEFASAVKDEFESMDEGTSAQVAAVLEGADGAEAEAAIAPLVESLRAVCERQKQRLDSCVECHERVRESVVEQLQVPSSMSSSTVILEACKGFQETLEAKRSRLPSEWEEDDGASLGAASSAGEAKAASTVALRERLRSISRLQASIQKLRSHFGVLRTMREQQVTNMVHLETIIGLEDAYRAFVLEVARRRSYHDCFSAQFSAAMEDIARLRANEIAHRESFWQQHGYLMPPIFHELVPTLARPPPHFAPQMPAGEASLPEVSAADAGAPGGDASPAGADDAAAPEPVSRSIILPAETPGADAGRDAETPAAAVAKLRYENLQLKAQLLDLQQSRLRGSGGSTAAGEGSPSDIASGTLPSLVSLVMESVGSGAESTDGAAATADAAVAAVRQKMTRLGELEGQVSGLTARLEGMVAADRDKISYGELRVGDKALFLPATHDPEDNQYTPFVARASNRRRIYMHPDSVTASRSESGGPKPTFIVGRIIEMQPYDGSAHQSLQIANTENCVLALVEIVDSAYAAAPNEEGDDVVSAA